MTTERESHVAVENIETVMVDPKKSRGCGRTVFSFSCRSK